MWIALQNVFVALTGLAFCWVTVPVSFYDALRGDRGGLVECQRTNWRLWWEVYEELRA